MATAPDRRWITPDGDLREKMRETDRRIADGSIWDDVMSEEQAEEELERITGERRCR